MNRIICVIVFFVLCCLPSLSVHAEDAATVDGDVARLQKQYEQIRDMKGRFVQKSVVKDLKKTETFKGAFFIKRPMKMKWSYEGDSPQDVVISNGAITIYQKKEKQAFRGAFDRENFGQAPIALLSGFGNIREEFSVSGRNGKLLLKPKKPMGSILSIEVELSGGEFPIRAFTVLDAYSNSVTISLGDVMLNTGLDDALFVPAIPKDVTVFGQ